MKRIERNENNRKERKKKVAWQAEIKRNEEVSKSEMKMT